jgi:hypothetical protein
MEQGAIAREHIPDSWPGRVSVFGNSRFDSPGEFPKRVVQLFRCSFTQGAKEGAPVIMASQRHPTCTCWVFVTDLTGDWHNDSCLCFQNNRHDLQIGQRFPMCGKYIELEVSAVQLWLCKKILSSSAESSKATIPDRVFSWLRKLLGSNCEKQYLFTTSIQCPKNHHKSFDNAWIRLWRSSLCWQKSIIHV